MTQIRDEGIFVSRRWQRATRGTAPAVDWTLVDQPTTLLSPAISPLPPESQGRFQRLLSLLPRRIMGFSLVGGSVMVGGIVFLFILVHFLRVEEHIAYLLQAIASIESNFFLNRFMNWKERDGNLFAQWIKFHSTSAITFPLNQVLFALLTWLGVQYLLVTIIGAGIAAIVNYVANDRYVFHGHDISKDATVRIRPVQPLTKFPRVGVVIPVRNSQRTIRRCVESLLRQDYQGSIDIFIVGNLPEQDSTWQALHDLEQYPAIHRLQIARPAHYVGRDANMKRYQGSQEAIRNGDEIVAFLDSQVEAPPNWLSTAVRLLHEQGTDGLAGRSCHHPRDRSLPGIYQDGSLFSEWPHYGSGFVLRQQNFGQTQHLPITANLLLTRAALLHIGQAFPNLPTAAGWDDFQIAWQMVQAGCDIFCTDQIRVYRNHKRRFRLFKQFSSGISGVAFYRDYPQCPYAQRRIFEMTLVLGCLLLASVMALFVCAMGSEIERMTLAIVIVDMFSFLGAVSAWKARDWRGLVFPFLDMFHVGFWVAGALYALFQGGSIRPTVASALVGLR
ncbi:MAG TPA: GtrA family protein [Ktedonobacteraceae bacterium]|nr:GtrA family protein [Ktedonobacteraceae bacterium]